MRVGALEDERRFGCEGLDEGEEGWVGYEL